MTTHPDTNNPPHQSNNVNNQAVLQSQLDAVHMNNMGSGFLPEQFVPNITEQEQEIANNMILYLKVHIDGLLATIHHLRTENENLKKEKMDRQHLGDVLRYECLILKNQLRLTQHGGEVEHQTSSMILGVVPTLSADAFPSPGVCTGSPTFSGAECANTQSTGAGGTGVGCTGSMSADATVNYLSSLTSYLPSPDTFGVGGPPVPISEENH